MEASGAPRGGAYFDHNATTPLDPRVREAMLPWMGERFGNPSSAHRFGQAAREAVEEARAEVARLVEADPLEIVFTASGTEANNAVVFGLTGRAPGDLVVSAIEHPSILVAAECAVDACRVEVTRIAPGEDGVVPVDRFIAALGAETRLAALMLANNELGTVQPVAGVACACRERGIPILCDAVQAVGKIPVDVRALGVDYLSIGAHKFGGPLGGAALWIRKGAPPPSLLVGGTQERRRRASTVNVPAVVGFGRAATLARLELPERTRRMTALRDRFEAAVISTIPDAIVHGSTAARLPHTSNIAFPGVVNLDLMIRLDLEGFAVSIGAACHSGSVEPSATLLAMGIAHEEALGTLRVSFGTSNTDAEVDAFLPVLAASVAALRASGRPAGPRAAISETTGVAR